MHRFLQKYEPRSPRLCTFLFLIVPTVGSVPFVEGPLSTLGSLFRVYAIFYTTLISSVVFYRLSPFHPLARYPGPVQAKISKLWFVSNCGGAPGRPRLILCLSKARLGWQGKQHVHYRDLHKKYGDVVRVGTLSFTFETWAYLNPSTTSGPNEIMLSDFSVIPPLLGPGGWGKGSCT